MSIFFDHNSTVMQILPRSGYGIVARAQDEAPEAVCGRPLKRVEIPVSDGRRGMTGRRGDRETGRQGDGETGRRGDRETGRRGDRETGKRTESVRLGTRKNRFQLL